MKAVLVAMIVAGCAPDTIPIDQYNAALARADCERAVRCGSYDTLARCMSTANPTGPITPSIAAGVVGHVIVYDDVQAVACVDEHATTSCSLVDEIPRISPTATCRGVVRSERPDESPCASDAECESRACSVDCRPDTCCMGTCIEGTHLVEIGDDCSSNPCAPDAWCDFASSTCRALLPLGAACDQALQCDWGLDCFDTCQPAPTLGEPCRAFGGEPWCGESETLWCDTSTQTCRGPIAEGQPCDQNDDHCAAGYLYCDQTSTCVLFPSVGESCLITPGCGAGAYCTFGLAPICLPLVDDGSPCDEDDECKSGVCSFGAGISTGACVEPVACT